MLLIGLLALGLAWAFVVAVVIGVCASAARGDRAPAAPVAAAGRTRRAPLRIAV